MFKNETEVALKRGNSCFFYLLVFIFVLFFSFFLALQARSYMIKHNPRTHQCCMWP